MPIKSHDLHGNAPDDARAALLLIDVINDLEFEGGERLAKEAGALADRILGLKERCRQVGIPTIYVNDNFGKWRSDFHAVLKHCSAAGVRGCELAQRLAPATEDYVVLKPKHSAFYATPLDELLRHIGARSLILAGIAADSCVLFSANDAYLRAYDLFVPRDCSLSLSEQQTERALRYLQDSLGANTRPADELDLAAMAKRDSRGQKAS